ncbi:MAG: hypothetical protein K2G40_08285 [Muribaculaceae bacterium]|nr:hypothetical protein [Muribaculaceae bacterium]
METPPPVPSEFLSKEKSTPELTTSSSPTLSPEIEAMIAEAESRGYHKGRNEAIANLMAPPSDTDPTLSQHATSHEDENSSILILNSFRPSIWD